MKNNLFSDKKVSIAENQAMIKMLIIQRNPSLKPSSPYAVEKLLFIENLCYHNVYYYSEHLTD